MELYVFIILAEAVLVAFLLFMWGTAESEKNNYRQQLFESEKHVETLQSVLRAYQEINDDNAAAIMSLKEQVERDADNTARPEHLRARSRQILLGINEACDIFFEGPISSDLSAWVNFTRGVSPMH